MHFKWNYVSPTSEKTKAANELREGLDASPLLAQLLIRCGITTESAAKRFFRSQLADLTSPFLMKNMDLAIGRLNSTMGHKERIMMYGDYDVNDCIAVVLVCKLLQRFYFNIDYYIPNRYDEGYGVSKEGIDHAQGTDAKLIITLDRGIEAINEIAYVKDPGVGSVICDHHVPDEVMPPAVATLNPKRPDDSCPFKYLSGYGVGFKFMQTFAKNSSIPFSWLIPLFDFCAVGISADIVPVTDENRILASHGLKQLSQNPSVGLKAIIDICNPNGKDTSTSDIAFKIRLHINVSKRMENGKENVGPLVEKDFASALKQAKHIGECNKRRKDTGKQMTEEADLIVAKLESQKHHLPIIPYNENQRRGIIGIAASRLTETCFRSTVVLTRDDEFATGSTHSMMGFDVYSAIKSCRDLLVNFGGHIHTTDSTLRWDDIKKLRERFQRYVDLHIEPEQTGPILDIDVIIDSKGITKRLHTDLKKLLPFGLGNSRPLFGILSVFDYGTNRVVGRGQEYIKLELADSKLSNIVNGIVFGQNVPTRYIKSKRGFDIAYALEDSVFKCNAVQLRIEDIRPIEKEEQDF